jgi:lysophospholipase
MLLAADESRVLVIYTGGTIGMLPGSSGYVPEPFYLTETLRAQQRFHDPLGDSLFSHSRSVEGFREWSGRNTPVNSPKAATTVFPLPLSYGPDTPITELGRPTSTPSPPGPPTLLVRSSRPLTVPPRSGLSPSGMIDAPRDFMPTCKKINDNCYEIHLPSLVTPASPAPSGNLKRIRYAVLEVSDEGRLFVAY